MTDFVDDNSATVDKIVYLIQQNGQTLVPDTDNDSEDLHVCRKCNKVFQSLAGYLEHKVKYENYHISQTLSKLDSRMVLPRLVQMQKETYSNEEAGDVQKDKAITLTELDGIQFSKPASFVSVDFELPLDTSIGKEESVAELKQEDNFLQDQAPKKRGRKRKSAVPKVPSTPQSTLEISYTCKVCGKKFKRKATLRSHMKYEHDKENGADTDDEKLGEVTAENNGDFRVDMEKEENDDHHFEEDEHKTPQEIHAIIEQPQNIDQLETATEDLAGEDESSQPRKTITKRDKEAKDQERPFVCDICGRHFKKMTVLRTHGAVHSDERKFVCTVENCPYGFKLKGGLVRHMRRHTGERPYVCENCGRAFSESGALTRHMKCRRNCARSPGSAYPHYMKNWTYHPNIPAVIDPSQRDAHGLRSKVFKSLTEYQECKDIHGNYSIHRTRSVLDQQMVLRQKQKRKENARKRKATTNTKIKDANSSKPGSFINVVCELAAGKVLETEDEIDELEQTDLEQDQTPKKRGRRRKSVGPEAVLSQSDFEILYVCTICEKRFKREATLRWHMKYEHGNGKGNMEDSYDEITGEAVAENDEDFRVDMEKEENDDHNFEEDEHKTTQEIHVIIEQPHNIDQLEAATEDLADEDESSQPHKQIIIKSEQDLDRPFMCDICGQRFKKMTALKTHGAVHSGERKYLCTVKNCPYGFKLKGSLVRHMRRHTGERPYVCENCGRAFSESGALSRHMKSRRNCARTPDSGYHRYMTNWTYHPNIPAVVDPFQRCVHPGQSAIQCPEWDPSIASVHDTTDIIAISNDDVMCEVIKPLDSLLELQEAVTTTTTQQALDKHTVSSQEPTQVDPAHDTVMMDLNSSTEVQFLQLMQCCVCKKDLGTIEGLEIHLRSHLADQPARCGFCHFLSHDQEELRHHILTMHYDSLKDIEASVLSMEEDEGGMKSETTQDKKNTTRDALLAVKQLYSLKRQRPSVEVENERSARGKLQCMVCNRFFGLRSYLQQHMRTHTGDRPHQCHVCHRSFTSREILKKHMYVHQEQRNFKCEECGKLFKRLTYVQQHLKTHSQERTIQCSLCDKLFRTQYSLTVHMRTHSGVNPYKCHVCNKHFRERGSLRRHMRLHAGEKPYKCPLCNRAFAENGTLSRHLKAKVPCSARHTKHTVTSLDHNQVSDSNMLTQLSTVVVNTQQYIQHIESGQQFILPTMQEVQGAETLHIFDGDISESVIIVTDKSIVDLITV